MPSNAHDKRAFERAARLLGRKLGMDWRTLPREQVEEYMRKLDIAAQACLTGKPRPKPDQPG